MGNEMRARVTLSLCCLLVAACGGPLPVDTNGQTESWNATTSPTTPKTMTMSAAAGGKAPFAGVMRATARIMPLMLSSTPATGAAGATATGSAGTAAAAAGAGAAGTAATASSGSAGASASSAGSGGSKASGGSGGSAGRRSFANNDGFNTYAAGSGSAAGSTGSAGTTSGAAGMSGSTTASGAAGTAAPSTGAAGMTAAPTSPATTGAGGATAVASIVGSATFASSSSGVNLTVMVSGCVDGKEYPMHIHTGSSCDSVMTQMGHWDMTRGEGIPNLKCGGKQGATMTMRTSMDPTTAWSVGDGTATDVIGHVVVIHDADDPTQRIACGQILKN